MGGDFSEMLRKKIQAAVNDLIQDQKKKADKQTYDNKQKKKRLEQQVGMYFTVELFQQGRGPIGGELGLPDCHIVQKIQIGFPGFVDCGRTDDQGYYA